MSKIRGSRVQTTSQLIFLLAVEENGKIIRCLCPAKREKFAAEDVKVEGATVYYRDDIIPDPDSARLFSLVPVLSCLGNIFLALNVDD